MVPRAGIEPARWDTYRRILSPVRLPFPPPRPQHIAVDCWSGRRGSNPRPPPWQGGVLPLNYFRKMLEMVRVEGLEPPRRETLDPKSSASANSATPAIEVSHTGIEPVTL